MSSKVIKKYKFYSAKKKIATKDIQVGDIVVSDNLYFSADNYCKILFVTAVSPCGTFSLSFLNSNGNYNILRWYDTNEDYEVLKDYTVYRLTDESRQLIIQKYPRFTAMLSGCYNIQMALNATQSEEFKDFNKFCSIKLSGLNIIYDFMNILSKKQFGIQSVNKFYVPEIAKCLFDSVRMNNAVVTSIVKPGMTLKAIDKCVSSIVADCNILDKHSVERMENIK